MTMTPTELRVLADVLESDGWKRLADYLRQCAEQRPVAYKHTESDGGMTYFVADEAPCEKCVPLYTHPAPAAPQAAPMADSDADYWLRNRQPILDAIERAGFMLMSNASGFWLHPRGATDAQAEPKREPTCLWSRADDDTDVWETSCGHAFTIIEGTPSDNHMEFCCYCGRRVDEEIGGSDE